VVISDHERHGARGQHRQRSRYAAHSTSVPRCWLLAV
jgi:hypothetical protein